MTTSTVGLDEFPHARPRLFRIACRIVGNPHEAEELVQDVAAVAARRTGRQSRIRARFLATTVSRLAINLVQSARRLHETCVGPWLSEESAVGGVDPQIQVRTAGGVRRRRTTSARASVAGRAGHLCTAGGVRVPVPADRGDLVIGAPNARQLVKRARDRLASDRCHLVA